MSFILTIFSAIIIFILSQFVLKLILEPIFELKKIMGLISYTLLLFRSKLTNAVADNEVSKEVKTCSSKLLAIYSTIPLYRYLYKIFYLPSYTELLEAARNLNLIHSYMLEGYKEHIKSCNLKIHLPIEISNAIDKIGELLNVTTSYQEETNT
ncbi:Uncharacterised protein [Legionella busanensis]|uniref:Transmembrane protein n=1 Tax=Legionella busanensis TaxID=190655 RepID=A0A378JJS8_9GAMM|nr:hypothetical protein [Legionella busanensis]STX50469.1 Uncharacterised protein [Legionella busanensis]